MKQSIKGDIAMNKKSNSFYDNRGHLYVDCTECVKGHFGEEVDKCVAGERYKNQAGDVS